MYTTHYLDDGEVRPFVGDLHVHSNVSDGLLSPQEISLVAASRSLDFVAISDHGTPLGGVQGARFAARLGQACPTVVVAQELHFERHVHVVVVGLSEQVGAPLLGRFKLQWLPRLAERAHKVGGAIVVAHPWAFAGDRTAEDWVTSMIEQGSVDGVEVVSTTVDDGKFKDWARTMRVYAQKWRPLGVAAVGSTDWHGRSRGVSIGLARTYLIARRPSGRDLAAAIRAGNSVASLAAPTLSELGACGRLLREMGSVLTECGVPAADTPDRLLSSRTHALSVVTRARDQAVRALGLEGVPFSRHSGGAAERADGGALSVPEPSRAAAMVHFCLGNYTRVLDAARQAVLGERGEAGGGARTRR